MKYFGNNDYELRYNRSAVNSTINNAEAKIAELCKNIDNLEYYLSELETNAHDKPGTNVDEDYKDFEKLLGYEALTGLLKEVSDHLDALKNDMSNYERSVQNNIERRRREEEARRRQNSIKFN